MMEGYYTLPELAKETGFPYAFLDAACHRSKEFHPLPHVKAGNKRPIRRVRLSAFEKWLEEEEAR